MHLVAVEKILQETIFPDLMLGRESFDLPHTKAVVYWMKQILKTEPVLNRKVLVTAAYAHDWGYIGLGLTKNSSINQVHEAKERHMREGASKIRRLLEGQLKSEFSVSEIERICHLVFVHDRLSQVNEEDEIALVEADTLGALDVSLVKPTFSKIDNERYLQEQVLGLRFPLFRHKVAIEAFDQLFISRKQFYE